MRQSSSFTTATNENPFTMESLTFAEIINQRDFHRVNLHDMTEIGHSVFSNHAIDKIEKRNNLSTYTR